MYDHIILKFLSNVSEKNTIGLDFYYFLAYGEYTFWSSTLELHIYQAASLVLVAMFVPLGVLGLGYLAFRKKERLIEIRSINRFHEWTAIPPDGPNNWLGIGMDMAIATGGAVLAFGFAIRYFSFQRGGEEYLEWLGASS